AAALTRVSRLSPPALRWIFQSWPGAPPTLIPAEPWVYKTTPTIASVCSNCWLVTFKILLSCYFQTLGNCSSNQSPTDVLFERPRGRTMDRILLPVGGA